MIDVLQLHRIRTVLYFAIGEKHPKTRHADVQAWFDETGKYATFSWAVNGGHVQSEWSRDSLKGWLDRMPVRAFVTEHVLPMLERRRSEAA